MQPSNKGPRETLETLGDHSPRICTQWGWMAFMPPKGSGKTTLQRSSVSDSIGLSPSGPTPTPTHLSSLVNTRGEWEQFRIFPFKFIANCLKCYSVKKERLNGPESLSIPEATFPETIDQQSWSPSGVSNLPQRDLDGIGICCWESLPSINHC